MDEDRLMFDTELLEAMPDDVVLYPYQGQDADGNDTWAPEGTPLKANVQISIGRGSVGPHQGMQDTTPSVTGTVIIPAAGVMPRDKLDLPGPNGTTITKYVDRVQTWRDAPDVGDYVQQIDFKEED